MSTTTFLSNLNGLTYDDVSIRPNKTNVRPDQVKIKTEIFKGFQPCLPILASPMDTVWSPRLTCSMAEDGAVAVVWRDIPLDQLKNVLEEIKAYKIDLAKYPDAIVHNGHPPIIVASSPFEESRIEFLIENKDVSYIIFDTVHPHNDLVIKAVEKYSKRAPYKIIVGSLATAEAAEDFVKYPIAGFRVGLGPGSICTTREISGVGVPQLQVIEEISKVAKPYGLPIIADGGIRSTGDIAKALAAGASAVMVGRLFAGTEEAVGKVVEVEGKKYKFYAGSRYTSVEFNGNSGYQDLDSFLDSINSDNHRVEGVSGYIPYMGPVKAFLFQVKRSLGASFAFTGSADLADFQERAKFIKVSTAAHYEGRAHSISIVTHKNKFF